MSQQPTQGWYPDPGGTGERYWDGAAWTAQVRVGQNAARPAVAAPQTGAGGLRGRAARRGRGPSGPGPEGPRAGNIVRGSSQYHSLLADPLSEPSGVGLAAQQMVALGGAAALTLGLFLPWATGGGESANAFENELPWLLTGWDENSIGEETFLGHAFLFLALAAATVAVVFVRRGAQQRVFLGLAGATALALAVGDFYAFNEQFGDIDGVSTGFGLYLGALGAAAIVASAFVPGNSVLETSRVAEPLAQQPRQTRPTPPPSPSQPTPPTPPAPPIPGPPHAPPEPPTRPGSSGQWWNN